jgi:hypothetical protein
LLYNIGDEYFEWLFNIVCEQRYFRPIYRKLLEHLHETEFTYLMLRDRNRAEDGENLRYRFAIEKDYDVSSVLTDLSGPCSVLEMMVALAIRCEEQIADDPQYGNRTGQWFWKMVVNLGLGPMTNDMYDRRVVESILQTFLDREYKPDGEGGLFRIRDCDVDLRHVEIWHQLCWYLDTIL